MSNDLTVHTGRDADGDPCDTRGVLVDLPRRVSRAMGERTNMTDAAEHLLIDVQDRVGTLTLNRPEKLNALSDPMMSAAAATLERWGSDPEIGCIVVTGAG